MDGTICDLDLGLFTIIHNTKDEKAERGYYLEREIKLNPYLLLHKDDEAVIITSRRFGYKGLTEEWLKYHGIKFPIIHEVCEIEPDKFDEIAEWKSKIINREKLDVYIDDNPIIVSSLRKLCTKTTILQYGARHEN